MLPMRVAHVSDLHLLCLEGARLGDFMSKRLPGGVNLLLHRGRHYQASVFEALVDDLNGQRVDHVVCTGDVTNLSLAAEFRFARARFERITLGPDHVTCIPGNHDRYVTSAAGFFEEVFDPFCTADPEWRWPDGGRWPVVRVRGHVAVVALSTSRPTGWLAAHGELGDEQLGRLERVLVDPRLRGTFRLVLLHHPPAGRRARNFLRGLRDHERFSRVLAAAGAELILHGHEHLDVRDALDGPGGARVPVCGIQSGSYDRASARRGARYRIYQLGATEYTQELRMWRPEERRFVSEGG